MAKKHVSYKGRVIDMELLKFQNEHQIALGNATMNARGDIVGKGGTVIKTREELLYEEEQRMEAPDFIPVDDSLLVDDSFEDAPVKKAEPPVAPATRAPKKPQVKSKAVENDE